MPVASGQEGHVGGGAGASRMRPGPEQSRDVRRTLPESSLFTLWFPCGDNTQTGEVLAVHLFEKSVLRAALTGRPGVTERGESMCLQIAVTVLRRMLLCECTAWAHTGGPSPPACPSPVLRLFAGVPVES